MAKVNFDKLVESRGIWLNLYGVFDAAGVCLGVKTVQDIRELPGHAVSLQYQFAGNRLHRPQHNKVELISQPIET